MPSTAHIDWGAEALWLRLVGVLPGISVEVLPSTPSTSTLLLDRVRRASDVQPCLLVAEQQTQGRGRLGRSWHSQVGDSLTFSLALPLAPADWSGLSLAVGLSLAEALDPLAADTQQPRIGLKWPNDLWLMDEAVDASVAAAEAASGGAARQGRKLGGILIETVAAGSQRVAVVGVGLNVQPLPEAEAAELVPSVLPSQGRASLSELDAALTAPAVLARVAEPLLRALLRFEQEGYAPCMAAYARRDVLRGQPVRTTLPDLPEGLADGVDAQGALQLRHAGRVHRVSSGEVSVRLQAAAPSAGRA